MVQYMLNTHYIVVFRHSKIYSMNFLKFEVVSVGRHSYD